MFNFDEAKRKLPNSNNMKNAFGSSSHNNLMSTLDKKRSDISKDKYIYRYKGSKITLCLRAAIPSTQREVQSSTLGKLRITKTIRIIKIRTKLISNFFKQNFQKNLRLPSLSLENKFMLTFRIFYLIKN